MAATIDPALKARLAAMDNAFEKAKANPNLNSEGNYPTFKDGKYRGLLSGAEVASSKSSGRLQINWGLTFLEGEYQGKVKMYFDGLDDEDRMAYALRSIRKFGVDITQLKIGEIPDALDHILKTRPIVNFTLKTSTKGGDFQNVYIDAVELEGVSSEAEPTKEAAPASTSASTSAPSGGSPAEPASESAAAFKIGDRVKFDVGGEQRVGLLKRIEGLDFYVLSKGTEYKMGEEDMVLAG